MTQRTIPAGLIPVATQRIVLANSTAVTPNAAVRAGSTWLFSVEGANVRIAMNSTTATLTTGVLYRSSPGVYTLDGFNGTSKVTIQRTTGAPVVNIQAFTRA
jgi:hypothetical protein